MLRPHRTLEGSCSNVLVSFFLFLPSVAAVSGSTVLPTKPEIHTSLSFYLSLFANQMLLCLAPPYSPPFALWLLRHTVKSCLRRGRDMHQGTRNAQLLQVWLLIEGNESKG